MNFVYSEVQSKFSFTRMNMDEENKKNTISENRKIKASSKLLNGTYSYLNTEEITIWEAKIKLNQKLIIEYIPDFDSTHYFLLNFNATQLLNIRINTDLTITEQLLNYQSKLSSFFWSSNVGINFMLPVNTELCFQLFMIPKKSIEGFLDLKVSLKNRKSQLIAKSKSPLFYLLQTWTYFEHSVALINKSVEKKLQVKAIKNKLIKYLNLVNEISNGEFNLWELYTVLSVEQELRKSVALIKPDIDQIEKKINCSITNIIPLFNKIFGKSILEYHKSIHMQNARKLLETRQLSILEVSDILGYKNCKLFSHMFKRYYMVTPKAFKPKGGINY